MGLVRARSSQRISRNDDRPLVGRVFQQTFPGGDLVNFGYDQAGNMTSLTPPGRAAHRFSCAPVALVSDYIPLPVAGGGPTHNGYDVDRNLTSILRGISPIDRMRATRAAVRLVITGVVLGLVPGCQSSPTSSSGAPTTDAQPERSLQVDSGDAGSALPSSSTSPSGVESGPDAPGDSMSDEERLEALMQSLGVQVSRTQGFAQRICPADNAMQMFGPLLDSPRPADADSPNWRTRRAQLEQAIKDGDLRERTIFKLLSICVHQRDERCFRRTLMMLCGDAGPGGFQFAF